MKEGMKIDCFGTTKMGPKGQIVIPSSLRKKMKMKTGDQFVVFRNSHMDGIVIVKTENLAVALEGLIEGLKSITK